MLEDYRPPPLLLYNRSGSAPKKLSNFDDVFLKNQGICDRIFKL